MAEEMKESAPLEIKPCRHMEQWVNALAEGSLTGFARWYTQLHIRGCQHCYAALEAIQHLKAHLKALHSTENATIPAELSPERKEALISALVEVEKGRT